MADILDRDVLILSRKAIGIFTLLFAYMDLVAPLNVSFTMFLLTGSAEVRYAILFCHFNEIKLCT